MGIIVSNKSMLTGKIHCMELDVTEEQLKMYDDGGAFVQHIFPNLTPAQREFLKTGITPEEWEQFIAYGDDGND